MLFQKVNTLQVIDFTFVQSKRCSLNDFDMTAFDGDCSCGVSKMWQLPKKEL